MTLSNTQVVDASSTPNLGSKDPTTRPTSLTVMIHQLVLKRLSLATSKDDDSNHFELEEGENWLRLLRKSGNSVLDDTQDMSQQDIGSLYPTILSMNSIGGKIPMSEKDCYVCFDVDGTHLAIKDMRSNSFDDDDDVSPQSDDDDDENNNERPVSYALGLARASNQYTWERLPQRQLRILQPGDRLCTFYNPDIQLADGLILEYRFAPKQQQQQPQKHDSSVKDETPSGTFALLTQPIDDDDDDDEEEEGEEAEDDNSQTQVSQAMGLISKKEDSTNANANTNTTNTTPVIELLGTGASNTQEDSDNDSDKTKDMTQHPIAIQDKLAAIPKTLQTLEDVQENCLEDSDDETTVGETMPKAQESSEKDDTKDDTNSARQPGEDNTMERNNRERESQSESKQVGTHNLPPTSKEEIIDLQHSPAVNAAKSKSNDKSRLSPQSMNNLIDKSNCADNETEGQKIPESAITLSPALCNLADGSKIHLESQAISPSMLQETGEETLISPFRKISKESTADANDSEITDIDEPSTKRRKADTKDTSQNSDSDITDVDSPKRANHEETIQPCTEVKMDTVTNTSTNTNASSQSVGKGPTTNDGGEPSADSKQGNQEIEIELKSKKDQTEIATREMVEEIEENKVQVVNDDPPTEDLPDHDDRQKSQSKHEDKIQIEDVVEKEDATSTAKPIGKEDGKSVTEDISRKRKRGLNASDTPSISSQTTSSRRTSTRTKKTDDSQSIATQPAGIETPTWSRKRKRARDDPSPGRAQEPLLIMSTGVELDRTMKAAIKELGGKLLEKVEDAAYATHLIAASHAVRLKRTPKLMIAMCKTANILNLDWLDKSSKKGYPLETEPYLLLKEADAEKRYNFKMLEAIENGKEMRKQGISLLSGFRTFLCSGVAGNKTNGNRTPPEKEFCLILEAAGAEIIRTLPSRGKDMSNVIVITSKVEKERKKQIGTKKVADCIAKGAVLQTTDEIFQAIMRQKFEVENF